MGDKKAIRFLTRTLLEQYREDVARLRTQIAANASALAEIEDIAETFRTEVEELRRDSNLHSVWLREFLRLPNGIAVPA